MALTKEQLLALGVPEDKVAALMAAEAKDHKEAIDGNYIPKATFEAERQKVADANKTITERDGQLAKFSGFQGDNEKLKAEVTALQTANAEQQKTYQKEMADKDKKLALQIALQADNCVDPVEVASKFDLEKIFLSPNGAIASGYTEQRDTLKTAKAYYFSDKPPAGGNEPPKKPEANGLPPGWVLSGQTPPAGSDQTQLTGPEAEAKRMAESMIAMQKDSGDVFSRAQNAYFGTPMPTTSAQN